VVGIETKLGDEIVEQVRERYGKIAEGKIGGCCEFTSAATSCCGGASQSVSVRLGYEGKDLAVVPDGADLGLGCGASVQHLQLQLGETVLDFGSGGGIDVFLAAKAIKPTGHVIGVDITPAMLERAQRNAAKGGYTTVEFAKIARAPARRDGDRRRDEQPYQPRARQGDGLPRSRVLSSVAGWSSRRGPRRPPAGAIEKDVWPTSGASPGRHRGVYFGQLQAVGFGDVEMLVDVDSLE
jgi:hypothetical protein